MLSVRKTTDVCFLGGGNSPERGVTQLMSVTVVHSTRYGSMPVVAKCLSSAPKASSFCIITSAPKCYQPEMWHGFCTPTHDPMVGSRDQSFSYLFTYTHVTHWQEICKRCRREASRRRLATNPCHRFLRRWDISLGAKVGGKTLKCHWWLCGSLVCTIC